MEGKEKPETSEEYIVSEQRHRNMQRIKASGTGIKKALQTELWHRGIRYRKNVKQVIGKPDIYFIGKKVAVFCDSEFWHGYDWENTNQRIKSHRVFWIPKIERNIQRDKEVNAKLEAEGGADIILNYASPRFCLYSSGLRPPRDSFIRFSRYQTI